MVEFCVEFEAIDNTFDTEFEGFTPVSDGGFDRGYQDGYADALSKRTDLVVTENGEYAPSEGSTGFKNVKVDVAFRSPMDDFIEGKTTEISSGASKIASKAFYKWETPTSANFPNATEIGNSAFHNCSALTSVNLPNVTKIGEYAFYACSKLTTGNFPNATSTGKYAFGYCKALTSANFPNTTKIDDNSFYECNNLTSIDFPKVTEIGYSAFECCFALQSMDFPKVTTIRPTAIKQCYQLKSLILRAETMCSLGNTNAFNFCYHILGTVNSTYNPNGDKDGYFYVPRALLSDDDAKKDYRRATNWSNFATQFRALEDYTVDGTINGALDETKI
jgi:hypothetical protein